MVTLASQPPPASGSVRLRFRLGDPGFASPASPPPPETAGSQPSPPQNIIVGHFLYVQLRHASLERLETCVGVSEAQWDNLRSRFRHWHSPISELLTHSDNGNAGVLLDYAFSSTRVETGRCTFTRCSCK